MYIALVAFAIAANPVPAELLEAVARLEYSNALLEYELATPDSGVRASVRNRFDGSKQQFAAKWQSRDGRNEIPAFLDYESVTTRLDQGWFAGNGSATSVQWSDDRPRDPRMLDIRNCVLSASIQGIMTDRAQLIGAPGALDCASDPTYTVDDTGDSTVVIAHCEAGRRVEWVIRDESGPLIESVRRFHNDQQVAEARITWTERGGVPVPARIDYREQGANGRSQCRELTLLRAEVGGAPSLTFEDAGLDIGTNVDRILADGATECWPGTSYPKVLTWDGAALVPWRDAMRRVSDGELKWGERFRRDLVLGQLQHQANAEIGAARVSNWRTFVRMFIRTYGLDGEQSQRAWTLHDEALARFRQAAGRLTRDQPMDHLVQTTRAHVEQMVDAGMDPADVVAEKAGTADRLARLSELAREVFQEALVNRVWRLPTRSQLRTADDAELREMFGEFLPGRDGGQE